MLLLFPFSLSPAASSARRERLSSHFCLPEQAKVSLHQLSRQSGKPKLRHFSTLSQIHLMLCLHTWVMDPTPDLSLPTPFIIPHFRLCSKPKTEPPALLDQLSSEQYQDRYPIHCISQLLESGCLLEPHLILFQIQY